MNSIATVNAGIYCRLSVDDQTSGESESIQTQKALLTDYCKQHNFRIVDYYIDDGVSGTSFERPEFQRMLGAIEAGQINTVICKDLSRFGRNYYEAGMYLDRYFVQNDIRFIAPGDNVDTIRGKSDLNVAIINMMNDFYARGISEKTKAAKQIRAKQGLFVGFKPPYGYMRDPNDRHHLVIDEEAALVVKRIFDMAASGDGYNRIARVLHADGIPNPSAYANQKSPGCFPQEHWNTDNLWHVTSIQTILKNPVYLGQLSQGRRGNKVMKGKEYVKPPEEWITVEDTHDAIVPREQWELVQKQLAVRRRACADGTPQMFAGLLYCSDCGSALSFSRSPRKTMPDDGQYKCWYYMRHGKEFCSTHYVTLSQLAYVVGHDIRRQARYAALYHDRYVEELSRSLTAQEEQQSVAQKREIERMRKRCGALNGIIKKLLEQNAAGVISDDRFCTLSSEYEREQAEIKKKLDAYDTAAEAKQQALNNAKRFADIITEYTDIRYLDARILNKLIQKIVVHQREKGEDGKCTQQIDIYYQFIGMSLIEL
ncbi:Recombinase [uncultured Eubacteriales bacterium]|uniref:Recombinase n=1 Tax=uncultured Eubacteriales bacterium TaxID=172733 RepID=A0A212JGI6_9FIRM|nr:Recombinase [uncultured Eubacteriales bacterium]